MQSSSPIPFISPICAIVGGCSAEILTTPIEVTKIRLQVLPGKPAFSSIVTSIYKKDGLSGFWAGIRPSLTRQVICCGAKFSTYEPLKQYLCKTFPQKSDESNPRIWPMVVAGGGAGIAMGLVGNPADLLKTRMQSGLIAGESRTYSSVSGAFFHIVKNEGFLSLWKGVIPMVQRSLFVTMAEMAVYDASKRYLIEANIFSRDTMVHAAASFTAGFAAALVGTPIDLAKNRLMTEGINSSSKEKYSGMLDVLQKTAKSDGILSLYRAFVPTWMRIGPWAIVMFMTYEQLMAAATLMNQRL